ncbi:MAG: acetyltransferase [Anaerolineae bacterium]|nr:acetyltransferase [Anaerolineae bacterium]
MNPSAIRAVILGGGGHARVLIDTMLLNRMTPVGILDIDPKRVGESVLGVPILGNDDLLPELARQGATHFAVGLGSVGDVRPRQQVFARGLASGLAPLTVIHPTAIVSSYTEIRDGVQIFAGAIINAGAQIGANVIVNTAAIVEHDCMVEDHVHLATGAKLCGAVRVGQGVHIGAGATVLQGITIGANATVGLGAVVVKDVKPDVVVAGVPARPLRNSHES